MYLVCIIRNWFINTTFLSFVCSRQSERYFPVCVNAALGAASMSSTVSTSPYSLSSPPSLPPSGMHCSWTSSDSRQATHHLQFLHSYSGVHTCIHSRLYTCVHSRVRTCIHSRWCNAGRWMLFKMQEYNYVNEICLFTVWGPRDRHGPSGRHLHHDESWLRRSYWATGVGQIPLPTGRRHRSRPTADLRDHALLRGIPPRQGNSLTTVWEDENVLMNLIIVY